MTERNSGLFSSLSANASSSYSLSDESTQSLAASVGASTPLQFLTTTQAMTVTTTPTVAQFLDASTAEYQIISQAPPGTTAFMVNGRQLQINDEVSGAFAKVWETTNHQLIIAYQGTTGGENLLNLPADITQILADVQIYAKGTPAAETQSLAFAKQVISAAAAQGISASNVFVTGHSLGGIEAEYVAQQTGLGGIGFESTGIPKSSTTVGTGSNFIDTVTYGDPVGNYASDVQGEQPFAPAYAAGNAGILPHYGEVLKIGNPTAQASLTSAVANAGNPFGAILAIPSLAGLLISYHLPGVQSYALGVPDFDGIIDGIGTKSGPVLSAANDTISQLQAIIAGSNSNAAHTGLIS